MGENMADRKKAILRAVTDDYITTAEPVGSRTIARKYGLGVSSATIRNEMADLEDEGYLEQPHASAGRIPSDKGYRFYVDSLMTGRDLSGVDEERIRAEYEKRRDGVRALIKIAARMLGDISQCAAVVVGPAVKSAEIRHIQLIPISTDTVLVLVVTNSGLVEHRMLSIEHTMHASDLERISRILNNRLRGSTLAQMRGAALREIQAELSAYAAFLDQMFELLFSAMHSSDDERVYVDGLMQLLAQPEFKDVGRARPVLEFLESGDMVLRALAAAGSRGLGSTVVSIGSENAMDELQSASVVSAPYGVAGRVVGAIAVVGPTRLDYSTVTALVGYMADGLSDILARLGSCESGE